MDERTERLYAVKNICKAHETPETFSEVSEMENLRKPSKTFHNNMFTTRLQHVYICLHTFTYVYNMFPSPFVTPQAPTTSEVSRREFEVSDRIRLTPHPCFLDSITARWDHFYDVFVCFC